MAEGALAGIYTSLMIMDALKYLNRWRIGNEIRWTHVWGTPDEEPDVTGVTGNQEDENGR
jgi:hypothetical protein